jgi:hypothetical protein
MAKIGDFEQLWTLAEDYLMGRDGYPGKMVVYLEEGQRLGQAFFNALSEEDQERIRSTPYDPYHTTTTADLYRAIEFLLDTE